MKPPHILLILALAILLRLSDLSPSYWADELFTAYEAANPALPFLAVFSDPGNPPLFYVLARFWICLFGFAPEITRLLPLIFSVLSVYLMYVFAGKKKFGGVGLLTAFMLCINIYSLITAQELRTYSLCILLTLALAIALFNSKNFLYAILAALSINSHYFMSFVLLSNFVWGMVFVKDKAKFVIANIFAGVSFLPFLFLTGLKFGLFNNEFNVFPVPALHFYADVIAKYGYGRLAPYIALIFAVVLALKKTYSDKEILKKFYYSLYTIFALFLLEWLFALIKPISRDHYHCILLPLFILPLALIPFLQYKNKITKFAICALLFIAFIIPNSYINRQRATLSSFDNLMALSFLEKTPHCILVPYHKEMMARAFLKYLNAGDEILLHKLPLEASEFDALSEGIYYLRVPKLKLLNQISQKYEVSFVRCEKDVIIAKVVIEKPLQLEGAK